MKYITYFFIFIGLIYQLHAEENIEDEFGQIIPLSFTEKILEAKKLRIPILSNTNESKTLKKRKNITKDANLTNQTTLMAETNNTQENNATVKVNPVYNPTKSIEIILALLKQKPDYYRGLYNLGLAYSELNEHQKAMDTLDKALQIKKQYHLKDATIYNSAGWVSMRAQNYNKAEKLFKLGLENIQINSAYSNRALHNNLGLLYFYTQRFKEAKKYLTIAYKEYGSQSAHNTLELIKEIENSTSM